MRTTDGGNVDLGSKRTSVTLPAGLARRVRTHARASHRSVSSLVREALEAYLAGQPAPELPSFTGVGKSGLRDISERAEELLSEGIGPGRRP